MRVSKRTSFLSLALALFLGPILARPAAAADNGFRHLPDFRGTPPYSITVTRTQALVVTVQGLFTRPLGGAEWTRSLESLPGNDLFPLLPNGDTLLVGNFQGTQGGDPPLLSTNRGQSWSPITCPGSPLLLCRSGLYCRGWKGIDDQLYWSHDLGKTWDKLSADTVNAAPAVWKNGIAVTNWKGEVFKIDPISKARAAMNAGLPAGSTPSLFNVGDSLFAIVDSTGWLFKCQAGNERWVPLWENPGSEVGFVGFSPFGITRRQTIDSLSWSRDYGKTWQPVPALPVSMSGPRYPVVPEENRLWATTYPLQRWEAGGSAWVPDVAGMPVVTPDGIASDRNRLFAYSSGWYRSESPDSAWQTLFDPEGVVMSAIQVGPSVILRVLSGNRWKMVRIDPDGKRSLYPDAGSYISRLYLGSHDRIYAFTFNPRYDPGSLKFATPDSSGWTSVVPDVFSDFFSWFAMDGERIVTGGHRGYYSGDRGNTWDSCPLPKATVSGMVYSGGAFLAFTPEGIYRSTNPPAGWERSAFSSEPVDLLASDGDTVLARDPTRLVLTEDGGRSWLSVETPYAAGEIKGAVFAWNSLCLLNDGAIPDHSGIQCGSLSSLATQQVDGVKAVPGRGEALPKLRLNWGRIEGVLPGGRGPSVSVGVDGRIGSVLRARLP